LRGKSAPVGLSRHFLCAKNEPQREMKNTSRRIKTMHTHSSSNPVDSMPPKSTQGEKAPVGLRKRALPEPFEMEEENDEFEESPRKKVQVSSELLTLCLEGVKTELRDIQEKYENACREHQASIDEKNKELAEKDYQIATLEHRLMCAELSNRDQLSYFYHQQPIAVSYSEDSPKHRTPRLCSRRGR
jgi:hypothetical protein